MLNYIKREDADTPKKLPLNSDEGSFYLMVCSTYSNQYQLQLSKIKQKAAVAVLEGVYKEKHNELVSSLCAAAVTDWKVPEEFGEFNLENVEKLLYEYPQIANQVDLLSSNDSRFLAKK